MKPVDLYMSLQAFFEEIRLGYKKYFEFIELSYIILKKGMIFRLYIIEEGRANEGRNQNFNE